MKALLAATLMLVAAPIWAAPGVSNALGYPTLSINDISVIEGNGPGITATFTVTLTPTSTQTVTVNFATADGTAGSTGGDFDYIPTGGALTFPPGTTSQPVSVFVNGDTIFEPNETFFVNLSNPVNATITDGQGVCTIIDDDGGPGDIVVSELFHGFRELEDLAGVGGAANSDYYVLAQMPASSYEVLVDSTSGDIGPTLDVQRIGPGGSVLQSSLPTGVGFSRSLRWINPTPDVITNETIRVRSAGCGTDCGADDVYMIRAFETTYSIPRFNNSGTQITVILLQNPTNYAISGTAIFWDSNGTATAPLPFTLVPKQVLVFNTAVVAPGLSGSVTVMHDGRYGDLSGKTVALEPATGFSFDSPMLPRLKVN